MVKKHIRVFAIVMLIIASVFAFGGCGKKDNKAEKPKQAETIPELYNTAQTGTEVDWKNEESVLKNAVMAHSFERVEATEAYASVYIELGREKKEKSTIYYLITSVGGYSFENDKLARTNGTTPSTARVEMKKDKDGKYVVLNYSSDSKLVEPKERREYIENNFPEKYRDAAASAADRLDELFEMEKSQIKESGKITREFEFAEIIPEIELLPLTEYAYESVSDFFMLYPDWIGSVEKTENGTRYIYETQYVSSGDETENKGILSFVKRVYGGEEIERLDIEVDGDIVIFPEDYMGPEFDYDDGLTYIPVP